MVFPLSFDSFVNLELSAKRELTDSELKSLENNTSLILDRGINYSWWVISRSNKSSITAKSLIWQFYLEGPSIIEHIPFSAVLFSPQNEEQINLHNQNKYIFKWSGSDLDDDIDFYVI